MRPENPPALTADMPELPAKVFSALYESPAPGPKRRGRPSLPRHARVAEMAVGTRLLPRDHTRLMARLAASGEKPAAFLRRLIRAALDNPPA